MRIMVTLIGLSIILLASSLGLAQPAVPNAGFEDGAGDKPAQWTWRAGEEGQGEFAWEAKIAHSGGRSVRVKKMGAIGYTALDSGFIPVTPGKTYRVSAWVYPIRKVRRGVYFMITQHKPNNDSDQLPNTFGRTAAPFVQSQWQEMKVEVAVREGNTRIRIHCIQAFVPSEVCYDDFSVVETSAAPPPRYVSPVPEVAPDLAPAQAIVAARPRAQAKVEMREGRPRLIVDSRSLPWAFHVTWDGPKLEMAFIRDFARAGVQVHLVPLILGDGLYGRRGPWLAKDKYDFTVVDEMLWRVLRSNPNGYIIFYMCCDPYPAWGAENPEDVTWDQNGLKAIVEMHPKRWGNDPKPGQRFGPSIVSHKLRADVAETLRRLVAHVEKSEAGKAVIGYHVAGFNDGQWFQWAKMDPNDLHLADYCPGAQASFREWLTRRYGGDVAALRKAWNRANVFAATADRSAGLKADRLPGHAAKTVDVTFETAQVSPGDRWWCKDVFLDPSTQTDIADTTRFYSEGVAESVQFLAGVIKQATPRPIICGTYYEDITCNSANHIALAKYLNGPEIDYLAGPAAYAIRMPGFQGAVRSVFGSTLLHGKTYLTEQDWRSWLTHPSTPEKDFSVGRAETAQAHNAMVRRECGMMLAFGLGTWWYDMGGGWFADKDIMACIAEAMRAFSRELPLPGPPRADLAVFVSEESDSWISPRYAGTYRYGGISTQIEELNLAGVPYRLYLLSDLGRIRIPEHRAYVFLNAYLLSDAQRRAIQALKRDGKVLAFVHAPGLVGDGNPAAMSALCGMRLKAIHPAKSLQQVAVNTQHALAEGLEGALDMNTGVPGPAFAVADENATPLAKYLGTEDVSCAARDLRVWKSVFIGCPGISSGFLHNLAKWAGCWTVSEPGDAVYASDRFVTIHALFPGHKVLTLAEPSDVTDLATDGALARHARKIELDMQRGETRWFVLDKKQ